MTIRETVYSTMEDVAREQSRPLPALTDDVVLLDSGLDSLSFAILIARLEAETGADPFTKTDDVDFPLTLGELVRAYETTCAQHEPT